MSAAQTLAEAREAGREGMERAAERANRDEPEWTDKALAAVAERVRSMPRDEEFIIEDLRALIGPATVPEPKNLRSWGAVTVMALDRRIIEPTGRAKRAKSSHGCFKPSYRPGPAAGNDPVF